jgi:hypothetical protein
MIKDDGLGADCRGCRSKKLKNALVSTVLIRMLNALSSLTVHFLRDHFLLDMAAVCEGRWPQSGAQPFTVASSSPHQQPPRPYVLENGINRWIAKRTYSAFASYPDDGLSEEEKRCAHGP